MKNKAQSYAAAIVIVALMIMFVMYMIMIYPSERMKLLQEEDTGTIAIRDFAFSPAELEISAGTTVTWTNYDNTTHAIAGGKFNSGPLEPGNSYSYKFDSTGVYDYSCSIHTYMTGRIVVK